MISWEDYWKREVDVFIQFDLAKKAMNGFRDTPEAVSKYAKEEIENLKEDVLSHFQQKVKVRPLSFLLNLKGLK